jgi:hypothetical protein
MDARALIVVALVGCGDAATVVTDASVDTSIDAREPGPPPPGLVAWFKFDNIINDSIHNYPMSFGGPFADVITADGYHGPGFYLNGVDQRGIVETHSTLLAFTGPFTIAAWVRIARAPSDFDVVASRSFGTGSESSFALAIDSTLHLRYESQGGGSVVSTNSVAVDQWTQVALTYDGTTKRVFIDGALGGSEVAPSAVTWDDLYHPYIIVGADEGASVTMSSHHFKGAMDDVMFFDRALADSELVMLSQ